MNLVDPDGRETHLWTTVLPGSFGKAFASPTHSFITVTTTNDGKKSTHYFAYGSKDNGIFSWMTGQLVRCYYKQDVDLIQGNIKEEGVLKEKFLINPPEGMSQEEFDNKVKEIATSFGNEEKISYSLDPTYDLDGNCNSSTYTILHKAGVTEDVLKGIGSQIKGIHWGWGLLKPWTKEEQQQAIKELPKFDSETKRYETLQNALP